MDQYTKLLHMAAREDGDPKQRYAHMSVSAGKYVIVFGGSYCGRIMPLNHILVIDPTIKKLELCKVPVGPIPHKILGACVCAIGTEIFMHGGFVAHEWTDELWKFSLFTRTPGKFMWERVDITDRFRKPSPRSLHSGWNYNGMLWIFGGIGPYSHEYLNFFGEMAPTQSEKAYLNNQLLYFDTTKRRWNNALSKGKIPPPCYYHATTIIHKTVWMYGGATTEQKDCKMLHDLYSLNMHSLQWTLVGFRGASIRPEQPYIAHTFTAVDDRHIVLFGGTSRMVWVWNIDTRSWSPLMELKHDFAFHTAAPFWAGSLLIFGGALGENGSEFISMLSLFPKPYLRDIGVHEVQQHVDPSRSNYQVPFML